MSCVDGGGDVRRHGDRAHPGREGPDPRAEAHPPTAEGPPGALLGGPLHRTVRGKKRLPISGNSLVFALTIYLVVDISV